MRNPDQPREAANEAMRWVRRRLAWEEWLDDLRGEGPRGPRVSRGYENDVRNRLS